MQHTALDIIWLGTVASLAAGMGTGLGAILYGESEFGGREAAVGVVILGLMLGAHRHLYVAVFTPPP